MLELRDFLKFNIDNTIIYSPEQVYDLLHDLRANCKLKLYKKRGGAYCYNLPCSFDIETSSFYEGKEKRACMYMWQMSIAGLVIIGRTWEEFLFVLKAIAQELKLKAGEIHLCLYVQNLSYEFQWVRRWLDWVEVFAVDNRKPVHCLCTLGIEFKCSYILSAFSLAKMGEHLTEIPVYKTQGLEYIRLRHNKSVLDWNEIRYAVNDVQVVVSFIYEEILKNGTICKIPLTNTGYVRSFCRKACLQGFENEKNKRYFKRLSYQSFIHRLTVTVDEYKQARRAFGGGFTHTDPFHADVDCWCFVGKDFTSAYPAECVLSDEFPMAPGEEVEVITPEIFEKSCKLYFCMFDIIFEGLEATFLYDNYLSYAKAWDREKCEVANGRLVRAERFGITLTNIDFDIVKRTYKWKGAKVARLRRYKRGYLPTDLVRCILSLYADKTKLKGIPEMVVEYMQKKGMCNATFGMMCQAIFKEENTYNNDSQEWSIEEADAEKEIEKYNNADNRFLFYLWALVITASCRRNLWTAILECKEDYIYADTDSIKYFNPELHEKYFNSYNNWIMRRIEASAKFHRIPIDLYMPKTIEGEVKVIGLWDDDGEYMRGKFLGAKRYLLQKWDGKTTLTVSGLNKKVALPYLEKTYGRNVFENFTDNLYIPKGKTGKLIHTYIDEETEGVLIDYTGTPGRYYERSSVHLEDGDYSLSIAEEFKEYIEGVQDYDYSE